MFDHSCEGFFGVWSELGQGGDEVSDGGSYLGNWLAGLSVLRDVDG